MSAHTPGPWQRGLCQVTKEFLKGRLTEAVIDESGLVIAITGEGAADANLIAAAPELLEALQAMLSCCYDMERNDETTAAVKSAMKAIYKATGDMP